MKYETICFEIYHDAKKDTFLAHYEPLNLSAHALTLEQAQERICKVVEFFVQVSEELGVDPYQFAKDLSEDNFVCLDMSRLSREIKQ